MLYLDNEICAFKDVRPLAHNHILVVPLKHIRNINTLKNDQETLALVKKMKEVGERLIREAHSNDVLSREKCFEHNKTKIDTSQAR